MTRVYRWALCTVLALMVLVQVSFVAGYLSFRGKHIRVDRCLNSACDQPCKPSTRFVRHMGVCK